MNNVIKFPKKQQVEKSHTFDLIQAALVELQAHMLVALVYGDLEGAEITYARFNKKMEALLDEWEAEKK